MKAKRNRKGIVLITTLLIVGFVVMFSTIALLTTMQQSYNTRAYYHRELAFNAAEAGINYAMLRIQMNPYWSGCERDESGNPHPFQLSKEGMLNVFEHPIDGTKGVVEGRVHVGDGQVAYFDIYFVDPATAADHMNFFNRENVPTRIPVCTNNHGVPSVAEAFFNDGTVYKNVPGNTVFLVCRGRVGNQTRIVESCVRVGSDNSLNSVAVGRGNINVSLTSDNGKILLDTASLTRAPFLRADGGIVLGTNDPANTDYLQVNANGGGRANGIASYNPSAPDNFADTIKGNMGSQLDYLPALSLSDVTPDTTSFDKLSAGTYLIEDNPLNPNLPKITYYESIDRDAIKEGTVSSSPAMVANISGMFSRNVLNWNPESRILEFSRSVAVSSHNGINHIQFINNSSNRFAVRLKPVDEQPENQVYFVNDLPGGNIYVEGEVSGIGTVISNGDLSIEAQSQLDANTNMGVSLYAGGDVNIMPMSATPLTVADTAWVNMTDDEKEKFEDGILDEVEDFEEDFVEENGYTGYHSKLYYDDPRIDDLDEWHDAWNIAKAVGIVQYDEEQGKEYIRYIQTSTVNQLESILSEGKKIATVTDPKTGDEIEAKDSIFRGLVYACKDFNVNTGSNGFTLEGGLVAYGGDPKSGTTYLGSGNINITAKFAHLTYNSQYLAALEGQEDRKVETVYWASYSEARIQAAKPKDPEPTDPPEVNNPI